MDEVERVHAQLCAQREHVLGIVDGLDEQDVRRPVLPSGWSCLGLVNHLALDDERFWFPLVVAGEPELVATFDPGLDAWDVGDEPATVVLERYREQCARADAVIAATAADAPPRWWPGDLFGGFRLADLRAVLLHVLVETATHAGHLDAARELLDGRQRLVLDRGRAAGTAEGVTRSAAGPPAPGPGAACARCGRR
ncbi:DUF664 domain-containing protein [Kineococcus rhizosphaerae]|uniref:Uncharacterized protein DUF664 n=1 Tax=Kineococcus rhizosphaerae TaxID=559628 RepID=A0A2T0R9V5_9ACTN|nr:DUF664 domain-containing protein [Kineococcus rhizosphaerae]PRY17945.1 uncharacterized protein DUF664 [Kineococcus rhizosphaerae]